MAYHCIVVLQYHCIITGDRVKFLDEIEKVREEARRLKSEEGVEILIALGHSGYELDMKARLSLALGT